MAEHSGKAPRRILRIGKYEVVGHIATGGMGAVYRATDTELNRPVALKVLAPELADQQRMVERFRREAKNAAKLRHENIVSIYEFGEANGTHFLALEYVDGSDLHDYITRHGRLSPDEARTIIVQAARALEHADKQGIVHRDIKPSNFLISKRNDGLVVKLTDMGLAKQIREDEFRITKIGTTVGTVDYMAPEQARNSAAADIRSDIYALGCTLYHMLAGCAPFPEGSMAERIYKHVEAEPPDIRGLNPDVPPDLVAVLQKMLRKKPEDRYQTPLELLKDLENPDSLNAYLNRSDGLSRLADLAEEESSRPAEPRRSRDAAVEELEEVAREEEVLVPAGRRAKRFRDERAPARARSADAPPGKTARWLIPSLGALVLVAIGVAIWSQLGDEPARKQQPIAKGDAKPPPVPKTDPEKEPQPPKDREDPEPKVEVKKKPEDPPKDPPKEPPEQVLFGPPGPAYPPLFTPLVPLPRASLRREFAGPFEEFPEPPPEAVVLRVGRGLAGEGFVFATLAEALAQAPAEQPIVIEVHDNGPLFTGPLPDLSQRRLWIRAGPGHRPLFAWEHRPPQPGAGKDGNAAGPCLLAYSRGTLVLEDLDFVTKWPEGTPSGPCAFFSLRNVELQARRCTFSLTGKPLGGVAIVQVLPGLESAKDAKVRLSRCYVRGAAVTAVRVAGSAADVLLDSCLVVGGEQPLLVARTGDSGTTVTLRVSCSTLVAMKNVLHAHPAGFTGAISWLCCDTLLANSDPRGEGEMVRLDPNVNVERFTWRGVNCVFAGWQRLFTSSSRVITGQRVVDWMAQWPRQEGIQAHAEAWPRAASLEPEEMPAAAYATQDGPLCFAAVSGPARLGCELGAVPAAPEQWRRRTFDRYLTPAPALAENVMPPIPPSADGLYHGERIDLSQHDLGEFLLARLQGVRAAPRVVLHLAGQGDRPIGPMTVRGIKHLVVYAETPPKGEPLTLVPDARAAGDREALFEVDGGIVEMIGVRVVFKNDKFASMPRYMFKIKHGELRLAWCYLQGPLTRGPDYFQGLFHCEGATVAINESILLAAPAVLHARGAAARLRLKQSVVVAPRDVVRLDLGPRPADGMPFYGLFENNTIAVRRTFLHVTDPPTEATARLPVIVQAQGNVFLDPFADDAGQACLLRLEAHTLARGEVLWQGAGNGFDKRLAAFARVGDADAGAGGLARWHILWGDAGERKPRLLDLPANDKTTFKADTPRLERLALPAQIRPAAGETLPGANLLRLGIQKKKI